MRRALMLAAVTMLVVFAASGVAWAVVKTCDSRNCRGTENGDVLYERLGGGKRSRLRPACAGGKREEGPNSIKAVGIELLSPRVELGAIARTLPEGARHG